MKISSTRESNLILSSLEVSSLKPSQPYCLELYLGLSRQVSHISINKRNLKMHYLLIGKV